MKEKKFLLIEDDQDHAELITDVLMEDNPKNTKTEVILKKDGQEAMDYFQNGSIDCDGDDAVKSEISLVILDLNLPKIDGMDVLKFIKKNSNYCSVPVIILSTSPDQKTIDEAYKNGANGYFVKPSTYDDFVEKIKILKKCC
ncbi:MAG: response regulator [Candidatus Scalindua sediminis]|nr:response regulator [Candidatus Scalindua sediminis]